MRLNSRYSIFPITVLYLLFLITPYALGGDVRPIDPQNEETLLMFVGEDLDVLTIASRREESAGQAPAIAQVINREQIRERGFRTLSEALAVTPGFHAAQKEWGTHPYLRGIPDSVLFLYDTVPLGSDFSKSLQMIDHELSLAPIKRIEIVRGPASVLWGPDAFAGVVNVVPMTGRDFCGVETGLLYGGPGDQQGAYANVGHNSARWDAFLSLSGRRGEEDRRHANLVKFWGDNTSAVPFDDRLGDDRPDRSYYLEASGRFSMGELLTFSGRLNDFKRPYAMSAENFDLAWKQNRRIPSGFLKMESKLPVCSTSGLRFTGSYSWIQPEFEIIDRTFKQKEDTAYGELIYDQSFMAGRGLFTGGIAYREKEIIDALIWESYFPGYLGPENEELLPIESPPTDYTTRLWSLFFQYNQKIGDFDLWLGARQDAHDEYEDNTSFNLGVVWSPSSQWVFKLLYGDAYRTPFARQLIEEETPDLEKIRSLSGQVSWKPSNRLGVTLNVFTEKIENHIMEDPYAGLSEPNHQRINGMELEVFFAPIRTLDLEANLTFLENNGPDETYRYNDYSYIRPEDGELVDHYIDLNYPYDSGPQTMFNLMGTWRPIDRFTGFVRLGYVDESSLAFPRGETVETASAVWLLDVNATWKNIFGSGMELGVALKNVLDENYQIPGTYSLIEGDPFSAEITIRKRW